MPCKNPPEKTKLQSRLSSHPGFSIKNNSVRMRITIPDTVADTLKTISDELSIPVPKLVTQLLLLSLGVHYDQNYPPNWLLPQHWHHKELQPDNLDAFAATEQTPWRVHNGWTWRLHNNIRHQQHRRSSTHPYWHTMFSNPIQEHDDWCPWKKQ